MLMVVICSAQHTANTALDLLEAPISRLLGRFQSSALSQFCFELTICYTVARVYSTIDDYIPINFSSLNKYEYIQFYLGTKSNVHLHHIIYLCNINYKILLHNYHNALEWFGFAIIIARHQLNVFLFKCFSI